MTVSKTQLKQLLEELLITEQPQKPTKYPDHKDAIEPWVKGMKTGTLTGKPFSSHTVKNYLRYVQYFVNTYGCISYDNLVTEFSNTPIALFGRKDKFYRAIICFSKFLIRENSLDEAFLEKVKGIKPKRHRPPKRQTLTEAELNTLYAVCENEAQELIIRLLASTGIRASEFCDLRIEDVDMTTRILTVQVGKGGKQRRVGLNDEVINLLQEHLTSREDKQAEDYLFLNRFGEKMDRSGLLNRLRRLGKKAGIQVSPHALRRAFVTINANKGRSLVMLQIACGHADIKTTRSYCQTSEDEVIQAMQLW